MDKKILIALAVVAVVAVAAIAAFCLTQGNGNNGSNDSPDADKKAVNVKCDPYTITDSLGNTYTFDHTFGAVAVQWSISGGPFVTMAALLGDDLPKYLVGIDSTPSLYRMDSWEAYCKSMPELKSLPVIGDIGTDWDNTKVLSLKPTALILPERVKTDAVNGNVIETFEKANIPIIYVDFHREDIDTIKSTIINLGKMFGKEAKAQELADLYESKTKPIYEKAARLIDSNGYIDVYNETGQLGPSATGQSRDNTQDWGKLIYECGGNSIAEKTGKLDMSYVLTKDPDRIFFAGSYWPNQPDAIRMGFGVTEAQAKKTVDKYFDERAGWKSLQAYENNEVYIIAHCLGRDIYDFCSLEFIANMIWPDEFNYNPTADLKAFYDKYLPFDFSGTWFLKYDTGQTPEPTTEKATNKSCAPYTVTDLAGQTFTFDHTFGAVATQTTGSGGPFFGIAALVGDDLPKYLVGLDGGFKNRMDLYNAYLEGMPELKELPNIGAIGTDWDNSRVLLLGSNALVVNLGSKSAIESNGVKSAFDKAGIPIIYMNYHTESIEDITKSIRILGMMFGQQERAEQLATLYETKAGQVYDRVAQILATGKERPTIFIECANGGPDKIGNSYPDNNMWGAIASNLGANVVYNKSESYAPLDEPFILSSNPDRILFTGSFWDTSVKDYIAMGFTATSDLTNERVDGYFDKRAGWKSLDAYKNDQVYVIYHGLSRDVWDYTAIEFVAKVIWPDEFADLDPAKDLAEFYEEYMPFDLYGNWFHHYTK